jgi:hypothetical protein
MRAYADTSFLVKLLSEEPGASEAVAEYRRLRRPPLFYLLLHALEVENAIRHRAFHERSHSPARERPRIIRERDAALARLAQYVRSGALRQAGLDMEAATERARQLSAAHTNRLGARAIDLLHVGCALLLHTELFLTFDQRQAGLAEAEGLRVTFLEAVNKS